MDAPMQLDATVAQAVDEDGMFRRISGRILPVLMLAFFFSYLDRINIGFVKLQMAGDLHFSDSVYGFGAGVLFLGYFIFEVPSNIILHRVGARRWIARIMVTWGVISFLTVFVRTPNEFYLVRFLLGVAEAGFIPGAIYYMSQWYPAQRRGRAWGVFYIALACSGLIGGPVSGIVLTMLSGAWGLAGWKWLIVAEAVPTLAIGFYVLFGLPATIMEAAWLTGAEKTHLTGLLQGGQGGAPAERVGFATLVSGRILALTLIYFCFNAGLYGISFWMPSMIQSMGASTPLEIGLLSAIPGACAVAGLVVMGRHSDRHRERRWHLTACFLIAALGFVLSVLWKDNLALGMLALCVANVGIFSIPALFWTVPSSLLRGVTAAAAIAFINAVGNLAGFFSPYMIGVIKDATGETSIALYVLAAMLLVGAMAMALLPGRLLARAAD
jgi:MFS family permease